MGRAAVSKANILAIALTIIAVGAGAWGYVINSQSHAATVVTNAQHQTTKVTYHGQTGQTALALLEKDATVQTKHYSFGDMVTSIDGTKGTGPKYWTFYLNGKEASVGAGSYTTKNSDTITWELQP